MNEGIKRDYMPIFEAYAMVIMGHMGTSSDEVQDFVMESLVNFRCISTDGTDVLLMGFVLMTDPSIVNGAMPHNKYDGVVGRKSSTFFHGGKEYVINNIYDSHVSKPYFKI